MSFPDSAVTQSLRIVLFTERNSPFGDQFLQRIHRHPTSQLVAVVTRAPGVRSPDYTRAEADVARSAKQRAVPLLEPRDPLEARTVLKALQAEYFIIANFQFILPENILLIPTRHCLNFHVGPLPRYAGLIPWHWMWVERETRGGVTAIQTKRLIDGGDILDSMPLSIDSRWSEEEIRDRHFSAAYLLLDQVLTRLPSVSPTDFRPQDLSQRTYYNRDGLVAWRCGDTARAATATHESRAPAEH